jgi:putative CocE/NonD family hydrolase
VAVSPQAPIADWFFDDFHHCGALFLPHAFNFLSGFGRPRPVPVTERKFRFEHGTKDGYSFFLQLGPLSNVNAKYFHGEVAFWNDLCAHPDYDAFWEARNLKPDLRWVAPAVMTVGGWYDAEDLYGALNVYRAVEEQNPKVTNTLVMGPWAHGGWSRSDGDQLGSARFGAKTGPFYRETIELEFFERWLKGMERKPLPEAYVFETGANKWRSFDAWPPKERTEKSFWFGPHGGLASDAPRAAGFDEFVSDPAQPVPFTEAVAIGMTREYMTDDQRFASRRPDVRCYQTDVLSEDLTLAGPLEAELVVSTSGTDSDWIVKLIDVFPADAASPPDLGAGQSWSERQEMVRSEVLRGRYRKSYAQPEAFVPGQPTQVKVVLQDVLHTFKKGHRLMFQVQCTWFPLVDRNPQTFVKNIFEAQEADFVRATQRIYHGGEHASRVRAGTVRL